VRQAEPVLLVRHRNGRGLSEALPLLYDAIEIADEAPVPRPLVLETIA
jgi:hypothetical protein